MVVLTCGAAVLVAVQVRHVRTVARERRGMVTEACAVLDDPVLLQEGLAYPRLTGRYAGLPVKVDLIPDDMTTRQLPRLWLAVSVRTTIPIESAMDVLLQPKSSDIVSPSARFPHEHQPPPSWPSYSRVATQGPDVPRWAALNSAVPVLHQPETKDMVIGPGGVRVVQELARGEVGHYRGMRRSKFVCVLSPVRLRSALDGAVTVARTVAADLDCAPTAPPAELPTPREAPEAR